MFILKDFGDAATDEHMLVNFLNDNKIEKENIVSIRYNRPPNDSLVQSIIYKEEK